MDSIYIALLQTCRTLKALYNPSSIRPFIQHVYTQCFFYHTQFKHLNQGHFVVECLAQQHSRMQAGMEPATLRSVEDPLYPSEPQLQYLWCQIRCKGRTYKPFRHIIVVVEVGSWTAVNMDHTNLSCPASFTLPLCNFFPGESCL